MGAGKREGIDSKQSHLSQVIQSKLVNVLAIVVNL